MQVSRLLSGAAIATVLAAVANANPLPAAASVDGSLNGAYAATSNGEWAKSNEVFRDEASLRSTWTVSTVCSYPTECTGTVNSDQGWSAPIYKKSGLWYVKHPVANWEPCPDGTVAPGLQVFRFWPAAPDTTVDPESNTLIGEDHTTGISGGCGINRSLVISMPFKLIKIS